MRDQRKKLGTNLREVIGTSGATKEAIAGIVRDFRLDWGLGTEGDEAAPSSRQIGILAARDAANTGSRKAQHKLGKMTDRGRHVAHTASLSQSPARHGRRNRTTSWGGWTQTR